MKATRDRIEFLDGLRGLAILMVIIWHAYGTTYADFLPYHDRYAVLPIRVFWVGVELFFLISGFVITMTLERCSSLLEFGVRRWLRLFPAMLVASLVILGYDLTIGVGPHAQRTVINLLPGLSFISPAIIHTLTGLSIESMDGTFWSLYVEVSFYFVFALLFFRLGLLTAIGLIFGFSVLACAMGYVASFGLNDGLFGRIAAMLDWLGIVHFGWFASGALFYEYFRTQRPAFFFVAICFGTVAALDWKPSFFSVTDRIALLSVVGVFALTICSTQLQRTLAARPLVFAGFISYPLYLIHDNISVGLTNLLGRAVPSLPPLLYPVVPIMLVTTGAFLIAKYAEPMLRNTLNAWTGPIWMRASPGYARSGD